MILYDYFPMKDIFLGGGVLVVMVLFHTIGVKFISLRYWQRYNKYRKDAFLLAPEFLLSTSVLWLMVIHLLEIVIWSSILNGLGLVENLREATFFSANAYTTVGYGNDILSTDWKLLGPIIAISGLFTFGWTGSVLVNFVSAYNRFTDERWGIPQPQSINESDY